MPTFLAPITPKSPQNPSSHNLPSQTYLTLKNVAVARGEYVLCDKVSFVVEAGDICHIIGENGLGKTTLLMQIAGLLPTIKGDIDYQGLSSATGAVYLGHQAGLNDKLTVAQNLQFLLALYQITLSAQALAQALAQVGLFGFDDVVAGELSAGQTRRVGLARLWLTPKSVAPLWLLDEPLTALDKAMSEQLLARFGEFASDGGAIILTSHQPIAIANQCVDLAGFGGGDE